MAVTIEPMAAIASYHVIQAGGKRWLGLRNAGAIVRAIDPADPRRDRRPPAAAGFSAGGGPGWAVGG